ncbi:hypothetical protein QYE77_14975 (plasmid) [Thermanaerothrix sp. 4228-RoL]|jgi:hypothetical protein|uniref:Uncharacterized protein n=1 Tax=Thermanaerothrix solaris TaxID=3058434 RepID=A0ABU3NRW3_9CHLR|nr:MULTISPECIES: hypothetical protein [unclassified Thermanaerothrix]MDT8899566.1 hypothetical protein [Thermanaerothrix sp. 4228-RoL]
MKDEEELLGAAYLKANPPWSRPDHSGGVITDAPPTVDADGTLVVYLDRPDRLVPYRIPMGEGGVVKIVQRAVCYGPDAHTHPVAVWMAQRVGGWVNLTRMGEAGDDDLTMALDPRDW